MDSTSRAVHLDHEHWDRLQEVVERFERDCALSYPRDLEAYLPKDDEALRTALLEELVRTDLELSWRRRKGRLIEHYLTQFAELSDPVTLAALIQDEYTIRHRLGDKPNLAEYQRRFPERFREFVDTATTLAGPAPAPFDPAAGAGAESAPAAPSASLAAPKTINVPVTVGGGRYRLVRRIGAGAFGEVWEAIASGGVPIAIKRIFQTVSPKAIEREKQSLDLICSGKLRHPFLLQVFEWWIEDDKLHIAMELADGSLQDELKRAKAAGRSGLGIDQIKQVLRDAADALDFLNFEMNILHRDVKPANLLLMHRRLKLCDFGLARMSENLALAAGRTVGAGTPLFIAPEIIQGIQSRFSDQYSLAVSYYMLRTGQPLFRGKAAELRQKHLTETPSLDSDILGPSERHVLLRALSKNPDERFASCTKFVDALVRSWSESTSTSALSSRFEPLDESIVLAAPPKRPEPARRPSSDATEKPRREAQAPDAGALESTIEQKELRAAEAASPPASIAPSKPLADRAASPRPAPPRPQPSPRPIPQTIAAAPADLVLPPAAPREPQGQERRAWSPLRKEHAVAAQVTEPAPAPVAATTPAPAPTRESTKSRSTETVARLAFILIAAIIVGVAGATISYLTSDPKQQQSTPSKDPARPSDREQGN